METLAVVEDHRGHYGGRGKPHGSARFGSSPSRGFGEINCRAFEYRGVSLPTHLKVCSTPLANGYLTSPKTPKRIPSPAASDNTPSYLKSGDSKLCKKSVKSSPIPIKLNSEKKERPENHNTPFSELWAGPAYSNSPPPSSLPIPKFSMKPKRTVSLELPPTAYEVVSSPSAKSAPASPTRELKHSAITFLHNDDSATKALRRILNLDVADD